jgi:putative flavoprotein involved in K+ transport
VQFSDIAEFVAEGARMRSGETLAADLIVLATGYKGQEHLVRKLFGEDVARRVGPVWGFGSGEELRNMFTRTAQPGLWFIAGSFAQCRIYSKYLALQIKACEIGLLPLAESSRGAIRRSENRRSRAGAEVSARRTTSGNSFLHFTARRAFESRDG